MSDELSVRRELARLSSSIDESEDVPLKRVQSSQMTMVCYNNECFSEDVLRRVWDAMVESSGGVASIDKAQFVSLCKTLKLGLSTVEIGRVWNQLGSDGSITFEQFEWGIQRRRLLRRIVSAYLTQEDVVFDLSPDYDYSKPTCVNYAERSDEEESWRNSRFGEQRALTDSKYHPVYTTARREWQDEVVRRVAVRSEAQSAPWLVYTCGAMGAGKGYVLHWLSEQGHFPLEDIVHVDPDLFKSMMPEFNGYVERDRDSAGSMTHRESGFLAEITQEVAMERRQHVWIDGSLRDTDWYVKVFTTLRKRHPVYRIAIFYINASEEVAWRRTQARAVKTGRAVPKNLFCRSIKAPAESLRALTPYVDFLARLENEKDGQPPRLVAFETVDSSGNLGRIKEMMLDSEPDIEFGHFPQRRGPLRLARIVGSFFLVGLEDEEPATGVVDSVGLIPLFPPQILNWGPTVRSRADVPADAVYWALCDRRDDVAENGGLAYLDLQRKVIRVVAFTNDKSLDKMIRFESPIPLPPDARQVLRDRWRPLPESHVARESGATASCWIAPCEILANGTRYAPFGGQAFLFEDDDNTKSKNNNGDSGGKSDYYYSRTKPNSAASSSAAATKKPTWRSPSRPRTRSNLLLYSILGRYESYYA